MIYSKFSLWEALLLWLSKWNLKQKPAIVPDFHTRVPCVWLTRSSLTFALHNIFNYRGNCRAVTACVVLPCLSIFTDYSLSFTSSLLAFSLVACFTHRWCFSFNDNSISPFNTANRFLLLFNIRVWFINHLAIVGFWMNVKQNNI